MNTFRIIIVEILEVVNKFVGIFHCVGGIGIGVIFEPFIKNSQSLYVGEETYKMMGLGGILFL